MVNNSEQAESGSAAIERIKVLADCILEDRLPQLVHPKMQAVIEEINSNLRQVDPSAIPPGWFFVKAASLACSDLIIRFGLKPEFWDPWLSQVRDLSARIRENPWHAEDQYRLLAQCIPFYRNVAGENSLGEFSQVSRELLFPVLKDVLEDRYVRARMFEEGEISNSERYDEDRQKDSLCSMLLLESEVWVYSRTFLGGGPDIVNEPAQDHTRHLLFLLGSLIAASLGRQALDLHRHDPLQPAWRGVERRLRSAFIRLIQRTPLRDSAVPNQGTHAYARTGTHAAEVVRDRYRDIFFDTWDERAEVYIEPASSGMAAVSLAFSALTAESPSSSEASGKQNAVLKVRCIDWAYHETRDLCERLCRGRIEFDTIDSRDLRLNKSEADVFFLEPFSNRVKSVGKGLDAGRFISQVMHTKSVKTVMIDKTTDPFCLDGIDRVLSGEVLLVSVESLSKYMQYGDAITLGGAVSLIAKKDSEAAERARHLYETVREYARLQGQHMDPRLAWSLAPTRTLLEWRLTRMRRNATVIAGAIPRAEIGSVHHTKVEGRCSTFIYVGFVSRNDIKTIEQYARSYVHKSTGDLSYETTFGDEDAARDLFYKYVSHNAPLRLSTSFGFSTTALTFIGRAKGRVWTRISAGCESLPDLHRLLDELLIPLLRDLSGS